MKKTKSHTKPVKSAHVPATSVMLWQMEERLTHRMDSGFHEMKSEIHRIALLVEEQNAKNTYVLDGYAQIYDLIEQRNKNR